MALTKKDANAKYDRLRKKLEAGDITKERFKQAADRIYKMYHSDANKAARKAKPAIKAKPASKTGKAVLEMGGSNVKEITKPKKSNAASNFYRSSSGTRGESRPSDSPGPAVRRAGSTTGASVDPRERQLRKNLEDARRSRAAASAEVRAAGGSNRRNDRAIEKEVSRSSGGVRAAQRRKEERQRRARKRGLKRNRRQMLGNRYNKD